MELGLRKYIVAFVAQRLHVMGPLLCAMGVVYTLLLPLVFSRHVYMSENALLPGNAKLNFMQPKSTSDRRINPMVLLMSNNDTKDTKDTYMGVVYARRSLGTESVLLAADCTMPFSATVMTHVVSLLRTSPWLAHDVFFTNTCNLTSIFPYISQSVLRAALSIQITSPFLSSVFVASASFNALQPNLDLVNTAMVWCGVAGVHCSKLPDPSEGYMYIRYIYHMMSRPITSPLSVLRSRARHAAVMFRDTMMCFGGWNGRKKLNDLFAYDLVRHTCSVIHDSTEHDPLVPCRRECHTVAICSSGIMLFGGRFRGVFMNDCFYYSIGAPPLKELCAQWLSACGDTSGEHIPPHISDLIKAYLTLYVKPNLSVLDFVDALLLSTTFDIGSLLGNLKAEQVAIEMQ